MPKQSENGEKHTCGKGDYRNLLSNNGHRCHLFRATLEDGAVDYWEIKSTSSPNKAEFPISGNEFQHALQNEGHYFIIRILDARTAMPDCKILEEPVQLIREGAIRINEMKMELMG